MNGRFGGAGEKKGEGDAADQDAKDDKEGDLGGDVEMEELVTNHLDADKTEQTSQSVFQKPEHVCHVAQ